MTSPFDKLPQEKPEGDKEKGSGQYGVESIPPEQTREKFLFDPESKAALLLSTEDSQLTIPDTAQALLREAQKDPAQTLQQLHEIMSAIGGERIRGANVALITFGRDEHTGLPTVTVATVGVNRVYIYRSDGKNSMIKQLNFDHTFITDRVSPRKPDVLDEMTNQARVREMSELFAKTKDPAELTAQQEMLFRKSRQPTELIGSGSIIKPFVVTKTVSPGETLIIGSKGLDNLDRETMKGILSYGMSSAETARELAIRAFSHSNRPRGEKMPATVAVLTIPEMPIHTLDETEPITVSGIEGITGTMFNPGKTVKVRRSSGILEDGWTVHGPGANGGIEVAKELEGIRKEISPEELLEWNKE